MRNDFTWIVLSIVAFASVTSLPLHIQEGEASGTYSPLLQRVSPYQRDAPSDVSMRLEPSVAADRANHSRRITLHPNDKRTLSTMDASIYSTNSWSQPVTKQLDITESPSFLEGANLEFIKQLKAKKEAQANHNSKHMHPFQKTIIRSQINDTIDVSGEDESIHDSVVEESVHESVFSDPVESSGLSKIVDDDDAYRDDVPVARSIAAAPPAGNNIHSASTLIPNRRPSSRLTTVSFNIVHDPVKTAATDSYYTGVPVDSSVNSEPVKDFSQPAQVYSEPAKFYSEPAKIYSEPAKIYSEPAKIYGEPSKVYSEPSKFYSQPASLHLPPADNPTWQTKTVSPKHVATNSYMTTTEPISTSTTSVVVNRQNADHQPEKNYEVDEKVSVMTNGRSHGVQEAQACKQDNCKVGYVVEGRQYRKYRVEERTADGFIVGEYGVVRNEDGDLRAVRYTADGDASPRLIYDALMKFLQL